VFGDREACFLTVGLVEEVGSRNHKSVVGCWIEESGGGASKGRNMAFMAFSTLNGDVSNLGQELELATRKFGALGSSRTAISVALTGPNAGSKTVTTMWESSDACFDARKAVMDDPEVVAAMQAAGNVPVQLGFSEVRAEVGNCEGAFACAAIAVASDHSDEAVAEVAAQCERVLMPHGINGYRMVRLVAAGEQTGAYVNLFYCDSVDAYFAGSAAAWSDAGFVAQSQKIGAQIVDRLISRMV
jgi:hypothetical protein